MEVPVVGWLARNIDNMIKLPRPLLVAHVFTKFLLGVGFGALLAAYFQYNWRLVGWVLVSMAVIMDIPSLHRILRR